MRDWGVAKGLRVPLHYGLILLRCMVAGLCVLFTAMCFYGFSIRKLGVTASLPITDSIPYHEVTEAAIEASVSYSSTLANITIIMIGALGAGLLLQRADARRYLSGRPEMVIHLCTLASFVGSVDRHFVYVLQLRDRYANSLVQYEENKRILNAFTPQMEGLLETQLALLGLGFIMGLVAVLSSLVLRRDLLSPQPAEPLVAPAE